MTAADSQIDSLVSGRETASPPYIPLLGDVVPALAGARLAALRADPQAQARALVEVGTALAADVITVGMLSEADVGADVMRRIEPMLLGRGIAGCLTEADPGAAKTYCEAGAQLLILVEPDLEVERPLRTLANIAGFYKVPVILVAGAEGPGRAAELGLQGAVVPSPTGEEPGIVGGGLPDELPAGDLAPPRRESFFWAFAGEVPADAVAEDLAELGRRLHL